MSGLGQSLSRVSPMKLALIAKELRSQHALVNAEPIAIVGMGCRFPGGADSPATLWRMLHEGKDAIREVPPERWDVNAFYHPDPDKAGKMYCKHGAFLDAIDHFDADFFGISPREAASMDPQQRILLEVSWEALERAGQSPERLTGSTTGVFVGISMTDYLLLQMGGGDAGFFNEYAGMGNSHSVAAGRLSYLLGLRGPSMAVDTACSSSLMAVHLACQSLRNEECNLAIAGGVNLVLLPDITANCCRFRMLAPDGRCKTFDASADGYVRGEGCGIVVLKRYSDALADGDNVLALVRGSAANQDGRTNGLSAPSGAAQQDVIRRALASGGVDPHQIGYLEAHGTGTPLGDPIEFDALAAVLAQQRPEDDPLIVGSIKTNVGHLESAAGIAGLMKVVLALQHEEIPPHLNFKTLNPHITRAGDNVRIATRPTAWTRSTARRRLAGVNSFGVSGTNVHAILEEAPVRRVQAAVGGPQLLTLSAATTTALAKLGMRFADHFEQSDPGNFSADCHTANTGRSRLRHRLALIADSPQQARLKLAAFAAGDASGVMVGTAPNGERTNTVPVLPDSGKARWEALGRSFVEGRDVELEYPADQERPPRTELPTYPFEGRRFWLAPARRSAAVREERSEPYSETVHPLLGRRVRTALREVVYESRIGAQSPAYLNDHRVLGAIMFPAAGYVELALAAAHEQGPGVHIVENLSLEKPLVLPPDGFVTLQCVLSPEGSGPASFRVFSLESDNGRAGAWTQHASARITRLATPATSGDLSKLLGFGEFCEVPPDQHYRSLLKAGLDFGGSFRRLTRLRRRDMAAWGEASAPEGCETEAHYLVPTILDACFQVLMAAVPRELSGAGYLPVGLESLALHQKGIREASCACRVRTWEGSSADTLKGDLQIVDRDGALVADVQGFTCRRTSRPAAAEHRIEDSVYHVVWRTQESGYVEEQEDASRWLILGTSAGALSLGARLQSMGQECVYRSDNLEDLLKEMPLRGVIDLRALDGEDAAAGCTAVLQLTQTILQAKLAEPPRLVLVTRGAQAAAQRLAPEPADMAALSGLGRVIATEHPELRCLLVDLDPSGPVEDGLPALIEELFAPARDSEVAIRAGSRLVPRLVRYNSLRREPAPLRADASYLITGGLGALGLQVAKRLAERGARNLVLVGRGAVSAGTQSSLDAVESIGARITTLRYDVAHREDVDRLFAVLAEDFPPLRGIIHAAGVVDDDPLIRQNASRFTAVLAPKTLGAANLHHASSGMALDFFVLFSSISSLIGSRSQSSYAAANAAMDALAQQRRALGLPGIAINWGPWAGVGMAASLPFSERQRLASRGIWFLSPGQALDALDCLLSSECGQAAVFSADWAKVAQNPISGADLGLLSELLEEGRRVQAERPRALFRELEQAVPARRHGVLVNYITAQVLDILQFESSRPLEPSQGFLQIGMDSLMAVELQSRLQNALGVSLSSTVSFDQPTIERLATHIIDTVLSGQLPADANDELLSAAHNGHEDGAIDSLTEDQLLTLLNQQLGAAEKKQAV